MGYDFLLFKDYYTLLGVAMIYLKKMHPFGYNAE